MAEYGFVVLLVPLLCFVPTSNGVSYCWKFETAARLETKHGIPVPSRQVICKLKKQDVIGFKFRFDVSWALNKYALEDFANTTLVGVDFVFWCSSPMKLDFYYSRNIVNKNILLGLAFKGECRVWMQNLVVWAKATDLRVIGLLGEKTFISDLTIQTHPEDNETLATYFKEIAYLLGYNSYIQNLPGMFSNTKYVWPSLEGIEFKNMSITSIPSQWRLTMPLLQSLVLTNNNLTKPPEFPWNNSTLEIYRGLRRTGREDTKLAPVHVERNHYVRGLYLSHNNIEDLSSHEFRGFLHVLRLKGNDLRRVGPTCFHSLVGIQTIDLSRNKLASLPENLFQGLNTLQKIYLGENNISVIKPKLFEGLKNVKWIYLDHNGLYSIPNGLFKSLNTLEVLRLDANKITKIEENSLPQHSALRKLYLQNNNLSSFPSWIFRLSKVEVIDLSSNGITFEDLNHTLRGYDLPIDDPPLDDPIVLNLANNNITKLIDSAGLNEIKADEHISPLQQAKYSYFWKAFSINFTGNPLVCDCIMSAVASEIKKLSAPNPGIRPRFETWQCDWPRQLKNKSILEIQENQWMQREQPDNCPVECVCQKRCSDGIVVVDCERKSLIEVPSSMPQGLIELNLRNNEIKDIPAYPYLKNVTVLKLSNNKVERLQAFVVQKLKQVKVLLIDSNKLTSLPREIENLNFTTLALDQNLFKCDCTTKWLKYWLLENKHRIRNIEKVLCSSGHALGRAMFNLSDDAFICRTANEKSKPYPKENNVLTATIAASILGGLLLLITIIVILLYKYHGEVKVFMFTHFNWHPFDRIDDSDPNKMYDAFISYSGEDHQWVVDTLQERLENHDPPYKLCIHHRDFRIGAPIQENILKSVDQSKRMLMVLSSSFAKSEWCLLEFRAAHRKVLEDRMNYLIIIVFDDVDMAELDEEIKLYMRTNTYVSVSDKWFWQKLFYAMPQNATKKMINERSLELMERVSSNQDRMLCGTAAINDSYTI